MPVHTGKAAHQGTGRPHRLSAHTDKGGCQVFRIPRRGSLRGHSVTAGGHGQSSRPVAHLDPVETTLSPCRPLLPLPTSGCRLQAPLQPLPRWGAMKPNEATASGASARLPARLPPRAVSSLTHRTATDAGPCVQAWKAGTCRPRSGSRSGARRGHKRRTEGAAGEASANVRSQGSSCESSG